MGKETLAALGRGESALASWKEGGDGDGGVGEEEGVHRGMLLRGKSRGEKGRKFLQGRFQKRKTPPGLSGFPARSAPRETQEALPGAKQPKLEEEGGGGEFFEEGGGWDELGTKVKDFGKNGKRGRGRKPSGGPKQTPQDKAMEFLQKLVVGEAGGAGRELTKSSLCRSNKGDGSLGKGEETGGEGKAQVVKGRGGGDLRI